LSAELLTRACDILRTLGLQAQASWQDIASQATLGDAVRGAAISGHRVADTLLTAHRFATAISNAGPAPSQVAVIMAVKALQLLRSRLLAIVRLGSPHFADRGLGTDVTPDEAVQVQAMSCLRDLDWFQSRANDEDLLELHRLVLHASTVLAMLLKQ
jgi:hypothetical protein